MQNADSMPEQIDSGSRAMGKTKEGAKRNVKY